MDKPIRLLGALLLLVTVCTPVFAATAVDCAGQVEFQTQIGFVTLAKPSVFTYLSAPPDCAWTVSAPSWIRAIPDHGTGSQHIEFRQVLAVAPYAVGIARAGLSEFRIIVPRWRQRTPLDLDGNGTADFSIVTAWFSNEQWIAETVGGFFPGVLNATSGDVWFHGDFDGDGYLDTGYWRPSTGDWSVCPRSEGQGDCSRAWIRKNWGILGDVPVPADYDGDGKTDFAVFRPTTGDWWILRSGAPNDMYYRIGWGDANFRPVPDDYDGDGRADIAVWKPSTGIWWILTSGSNFTSYTTRGWGAPGDVPVNADYDGDGRADRAVWRPATSDWWILFSRTDTYMRVGWGDASFIPVPGDYDGDGAADICVFRPGTMVWWVLMSSTGFREYFTDGFSAPDGEHIPTAARR